MTTERERREIPSSTEIEVIGRGEIGDKARQLIEKTPVLREIGFRTPRRVILAEGFFDDFFSRNRLGANLRNVDPSEGVAAQITRGTLTTEELDALQRVIASYGDSPLAIRSSASGDSRGTGTYHSEFSSNDIAQVGQSVQRVLSSYFSESAIAFRRDAQTGEGFGIIVEPIIGQRVGEYSDVFAPVLSGFGYTSTLRGQGYVNVVPGIGGGVETRDGERITRSKLEPHGGSLDDYIWSERQSIAFGHQAKRNSALVSADRYGYYGQAFFPLAGHRKSVEVARTSLDIGDLLHNVNMNEIFSMIETMEQRFSTPQNFEWAMTVENGKPVYWITQVADASNKLDIIDFEDFGQIMLVGHTATGAGIKECLKLVCCWNPDDVDRLYQFNRDNKDYILLYSSRLTTAGGGRWRNLSYADFSNASVFLEIQDARHVGNPVAHLGGQLDLTGKLFAVLDYHADVPPQWGMINDSQTDEEGLRVYNGELKVVGSERQNRLVVYSQHK